MNSINQLQFHPHLLLRTPAYSFERYTKTPLQDLLKDEYFLDAITHASDSLIAAIQKANFDANQLPEKVIQTIRKYHNRMCYRCTPFGTMAGLSSIYWATDAASTVLSEQRIKKTFPSFRVSVQKGLQFLTAGGKGVLEYELNNTLYALQGEFRFIRYQAAESEAKREFMIESIAASEVLQQVIGFMCRTRTYADILQFITQNFSVSERDASTFLKELTDEQLLRCLQEPNITGAGYVERMASFRGMPPDINYDNNSASAYINMSRGTVHPTLDEDRQTQIKDGLYAIDKLIDYEPSPLLTSFKEKFRRKFEDRVVPLLEALDPEVGIDYHSLTDTMEPPALLAGVSVVAARKQSKEIAWTKAHTLLMNKISSGASHITLSKAELDALSSNDKGYSLPNTISAMFRIVGEGLFLENAGNPSGNALIGRFTLLEQDVHEAAKDLAEIETAANPDVAFAEVAHFSNLHVANIERRACLYPYEIPVVAGSTYDDGHRLALSDLSVCLIEQDISLYSKSLNKRIIPKLSSALNYNKSDLAVFRFLCDIQHQGIKTMLSFSPEVFFPDLSFYPRITYNQTILSLATWNIKCAHAFETVDSLKDLAATLGLPRFVSYNQGDHQLVFDLTNHDDLLLFASFFKEGRILNVKEFPFADEQNVLIRDENGNAYTNQFIASLYHRERVFDNIRPPMFDASVFKRAFQPGTEWLYLKLFCHPTRSNQILTEFLSPAIEHLKEHGIISEWFFVRYNDPGYHLRIRLHLTNTLGFGTAIQTLYICLQPLLDAGFISKYHYDTYERELERYHPGLMSDVERVFCADSVFILEYLQETSFGENELNYYKPAFAGVETILDCMGLNTKERVQLFELLFFSFGAEFNLTTALKQELSDKYRSLCNQSSIRSLLELPTHYSPIFNALQDSLETLKDLVEIIHPEGKTKLIVDIIHMHLNRCFTEQQRKQELVFYYCMNKHYMSVNALIKKQSAPAIAG